MKTKNIKSIPSYSWKYDEVTTLFIKWMTSQAYINDDILLFPLQIWKQPHWIKCSDQFRVKTRYWLFWASTQGKYKALGQCKCLAYAWIFLSNQNFYGFYRGEVRSDGTLIESERDVDVLVDISYPLILAEKSVVKLQKQQSRGDMENNIHEEWNWKYFHSGCTIFGK